MPARVEEVIMPKKKVSVRTAYQSVAILGDDKGKVRAMTCVRMELESRTNPEGAGPFPKGSEFDLPLTTS
jgi:NADPH-dependent glutamate synthase beta subunit-like oxidoreductase